MLFRIIQLGWIYHKSLEEQWDWVGQGGNKKSLIGRWLNMLTLVLEDIQDLGVGGICTVISFHKWAESEAGRNLQLGMSKGEVQLMVGMWEEEIGGCLSNWLGRRVQWVQGGLELAWRGWRDLHHPGHALSPLQTSAKRYRSLNTFLFLINH